MASSPSAVGAAVNRFLDLCRAHPNGLQQGVVDENLKDLGLDVVTQAINALLGKGHIQLFQQGGALIYKEANRDEIAKFKGLSSEDMLVYQAIQQSANSGIWTMDLKRRTNLQQPQVTKAIKNLETRNLIKAVKSVEHKSRKVYMLFELEPSRDVTGGAFYTEQEFDVEFISVLKHQCLHYIQKQGLATLEQVADFVRKSGITKEELRLQDFKQIIDMLVLDGEIEEEISSGIGVHAAYPVDTICYKVAKSRIQETSAFTNIPCGVCPVLRECTDDGVISPKTCVYYQHAESFGIKQGQIVKNTKDAGRTHLLLNVVLGLFRADGSIVYIHSCCDTNLKNQDRRGLDEKVVTLAAQQRAEALEGAKLSSNVSKEEAGGVKQSV